MRNGLAALLLLAMLTGCGGAPAPVDPPPAPRVDARVTEATTRFGIDLLKQVYRGENTFLSPVSASLVLSLTAGGARGETRAEMLKALRFEGMAMDEIHAGNHGLSALLRNPDPEVELSLANAIWHRSDLQVAADFAQMARERYGAAIEGADFGTEAATKRINDWTAEATRQKISKLLDPTSPDDVMILVNALYFKGAWTRPFDPKQTHDRPFTRLDATRETVPFMEQDGRFQALQGDGFRAVRLPYGQERVAMYLFVPDDLPGFVAGLTAERWQEYLRGFAPARGPVIMPKLKLEATHELNEPMEQLGLRLAFGHGPADFGGLFADARTGVAIQRILQKTFLEVNEQGTEAAAATAVIMEESAPAGPLLVADRPFLLAIRDDQTGALLFIGAIVDP